MIPKLLHYVWLSGDPLPELLERCRRSWEKWLPDYEWILWDRKKIEGIQSRWLTQTLETRNYAFATDFIRIYALYNFGGIYLDSDVELTGSFDPFLRHNFYIGFEYNGDLEPAVFGSVPAHPLLKELLEYYHERNFTRQNSKKSESRQHSDSSLFDRRPLPLIFNEKASRFGFCPNGRLQSLAEGIQVYPCEYFSPKNLYFKEIKISPSTVAIHHLVTSWVKKGWKYKSKILLHQFLYKIGGKRLHSKAVALLRKL